MKISIIIPAFNEEKYLASTLEKIVTALSQVEHPTELITVDNDSSDTTAEIAARFGSRVIKESVHNIGRVRNTGARAASGDVLVFIDADTGVPSGLLARIAEVMQDENCLGGSVAVDYQAFERWWMKFYAFGWKFWERAFNMKQGAAQFCRQTAFVELGGYDEKIYLGEDVEFYWRLAWLARKKNARLHFIEDLRVVTSSRRFDKMSLLRTLVVTNPLFIILFHKRASVWKDWYENAVR